MQNCGCQGAGDILYCVMQLMLIMECARIGSDVGNFQYKAVMKSSASSAAALAGCIVLERIPL